MKNETTTIDLNPIDRMISFLTMRCAFRYSTRYRRMCSRAF